jgi:TRAP-type C4-dicarboxylate transport system substrate-binding protein
LADNSWFKSLPDDLQEVVSTSVDEIASKQWQFSIDQAKEAYDKIINKFGSEVYKVPDSEIHEWAEKTKSCYKWFADQHPEVFKNYVEMNKKYGRVWPPK